MDEQQTFDDNALSSAILPPHSIEAEQSVLGGLLIDNNSWEKIADLLSANDFYRREHRIIYQSIAKLIESARPADVLTVQDDLRSTEKLDEIGGLPYLVSINQNTPSAANIRRYAEIVRERSLLRQLAEAGTEIANTAYQPQGKDAQNILDEAEQAIFRIAENSQRARQGFVDMPPLLTTITDRIQVLYNRKDNNEITGLATGFVDLDKKTSGLQAGDLIIVAGRPSMGKTAFAMNIAENAAIQSHAPVAVFSMEMSAEQLAMRMLGSVGKIDQNILRTGRLQDEHWDKLGYATTQLSDAPIFIDETPALTALEIRTRCRRLARQHNGQL
ncbi:MAG: replicative DNA helicase, partial [Neisseriaceae bacterium]|nr:replicative DNA helicase [Neisseriaceae bacterium]